MISDRIRQIEVYAESLMTANAEVAHDFKHADRVRRWALQIAKHERYPYLDRVEATALLHDIGLTHGRKQHAEMGARMTEVFLADGQLFTADEIAEIADAIRFHSSLRGEGQLLRILRDADTLDLLGAVGLMRAFTSKYNLPEYPPHNVKGDTWGMSTDQFTERFKSAISIGDTIVDQINFQISCYDNLHTESGRRLAQPFVAFMKSFMAELEMQICAEVGE